jgi:uncharacterized membrane protein
VKVNPSLRIDAPVEHVWALLADFGGVAAWSDTLSDSHAVTETNDPHHRSPWSRRSVVVITSSVARRGVARASGPTPTRMTN